ncbi:hypothetical protein J8F10_30475 [Gemmata sp. G18]|uniref:Uncharacterized protein n=1 Tax=Gemmata palustris TaxID=2822762 RepID=A0ABS5C1Q5_9BACT|nr:hypothetical protein [Gemmata palustris]MBP3959592.1 hypothetical protein [Gemmata palustris]
MSTTTAIATTKNKAPKKAAPKQKPTAPAVTSVKDQAHERMLTLGNFLCRLIELQKEMRRVDAEGEDMVSHAEDDLTIPFCRAALEYVRACGRC